MSCEHATTVQRCREEKAMTGTLEECQNTEGSEMWTHNNGLKKCEQFTYNGCGGNNNLFASQSLCQMACESPIKVRVIHVRPVQNRL